MLEHLQRLSIEVVQSYLEKKDAKAAGIKPALAKYTLQINDAYLFRCKFWHKWIFVLARPIEYKT